MGRTDLLNAFRNMLCQEWIPTLPNVDAALRAGGSVADVGCGNGQALIAIARGYPSARLIGFDSHSAAVAAASASALAAGLHDRVRFEVCDVVDGLSGIYDLITLFDALHGMPHHKHVLATVASALEPGGTCLVLELNGFWSGSRLSEAWFRPIATRAGFGSIRRMEFASGSFCTAYALQV